MIERERKRLNKKGLIEKGKVEREREGFDGKGMD